MARVVFTAELARQMNGVRELETNASSFRELLLDLESRFPGIEAEIGGKVAVAIDGDISHDPFLEPIRSDSEVYFLHRISGG
jgi:molybdopterin converting factor small subunit